MFRKHFHDICNLLVLFMASLFFLLISNADVLYMAQSRSLCMSEFSVFMQQVTHTPDGLLAWAGCWLTQLFFYPWLGVLALFLLWTAIYFLLTRSLAIPPTWRFVAMIPLMLLLVSEVDLGYWLYYLKQPGYWFRESLGVLCVSLLLWFQHRLHRNWPVLIVAVLSYLFIGWYAVLALLALALRSLSFRRWAEAGIALLLALLVPPVAIRWYQATPADEAWSVGFPLIESNQNLSWRLTLPFILVAALLLLFALIRHWPGLKGLTAILVPACGLSFTLCFYNIFCLNTDENYHTEIRMYRDMEEFRWDRLIERFNDLPQGPTRQMVMCKNLALINLHHLGDALFAYPNIGPDPLVDPSLEMHTAQTAAPMFYLQHGLTNDATHWCIENSVEYGLTLNDLRILTLAAIIGHESQLALKYINMMRRTLFGSKWARRYFPLISHPEWISEYPELQTMRTLHDSDVEYMVGDKGDCEFRIYRHFANTLYQPEPLFQEVALAYALMLKDPKLGMTQLQTYRELHPRQPLPLYYREALSLFSQLEQGTLSRQDVDSMIQSIHGTSYQWFFFKVNDAKTY